MAALHARAFAGRGRAWSAEEIAALLENPHVLAVTRPEAFALARVVADEAELLTIATDPDHRRQGLARGVLASLEHAASQRGAARLFLEVAEDNGPARGLYAACGFVEIARRKGYYAAPGGGRVDALLMEKALVPIPSA
ncbi:MAG: GNAT family N-acetyltransferase [Roseovarius sp.]